MEREHMKSDDDRIFEEAESLRGKTDPVGPAKRLKPRADRSAVLSVRIPLDAMDNLKERARGEGKSLSSIVQEAVDAYVAASGPIYSHKSVTTFAYAAGALPSAWTAGVFEIESHEPAAVTS